MSRVQGWAAALLGVPALQVLLGFWAYSAYRYPCDIVGPDARPACLEDSGVNPLLVFPIWSIITVWFFIDLWLLFLGLRFLQRKDARRGAVWTPGAMRWRASLLGSALAGHMLLGYWWVMAYTQGPDQALPGGCPACFRRAVREENALEAVDPGLVFLVWAGVDLALLWFGIWLIRSRREAPQRPAVIEVF